MIFNDVSPIHLSYRKVPFSHDIVNPSTGENMSLNNPPGETSSRTNKLRILSAQFYNTQSYKII